MRRRARPGGTGQAEFAACWLSVFGLTSNHMASIFHSQPTGESKLRQGSLALDPSHPSS